MAFKEPRWGTQIVEASNDGMGEKWGGNFEGQLSEPHVWSNAKVVVFNLTGSTPKLTYWDREFACSQDPNSRSHLNEMNEGV